MTTGVCIDQDMSNGNMVDEMHRSMAKARWRRRSPKATCIAYRSPSMVRRPLIWCAGQLQRQMLNAAAVSLASLLMCLNRSFICGFLKTFSCHCTCSLDCTHGHLHFHDMCTASHGTPINLCLYWCGKQCHSINEAGCTLLVTHSHTMYNQQLSYRLPWLHILFIDEK